MKSAINTEYGTVSQKYGTTSQEYGTITYTPEEIQRMSDFGETAGHLFSENAIQDMAERGFFRYPASQSYHGTHKGGLYDHSMAVYDCLKHFTRCLNLEWDRPESPLLVAIFHDWVKLKNYEQIGSGDNLRYIHSVDRLLPGHGEVSIILAQQFLQSHISTPQLTEEEIVCIRYHMGAFTDQKEWDYYTNAVRKYPNVLWTHTADMVASQIQGI